MSNKLCIFICENYAPELISTVSKLGFADVAVKPYPCLCLSKQHLQKVKEVFRETLEQENDGVVMCGRYCGINSVLGENFPFRILTGGYCCHHLANSRLIEYILARGGYVVSLGWLNKWRENIDSMGFDQATARRFFQETTRELVYFDAGIDSKAATKLDELSQFLDLPRTIIPVEMETLECTIKGVVSMWRLHKKCQDKERVIAEVQSQCAEYAAILDILGKIANCASKREVIEKVKDIFRNVMGASHFTFYGLDAAYGGLPKNVGGLLVTPGNKSLLLEEENRFYLVIGQEDRVHGVLEAGDFLFPQYIKRYLNFALGISQICALTLTSIERYEELVSYKEEMEYKSYHDPLTGLYNRTFFNEKIAGLDTGTFSGNPCLFSFDIDGLKIVNDQFGHLEGDKLLVAAGNVLKKCFREIDLLARTGGDEFIALVQDCNPQTARMLKRRIEDAVAQYNRVVEQEHLSLSISIGYSIEDGRIRNTDKLIREADAAMYRDKSEKRKKRQELSDRRG